MKKFSYSFTESDVKTFLCTLAVMPTIEFEGVSEVQQNINESCCMSAIEKFLNGRTDFHPNEARVMAVSLNLADAILKGEIDAEPEVKKELSQYIFSINKLLPIFRAIFD